MALPRPDWFTSDLHFGHENIISYCGRPFRFVHEMDEALIAGWNEVVAPDDEVWVLGDVCMGNLNRSLERVSRLHGRLHLVSGNHDKTFRRAGSPRLDWEQRYREVGFVHIHHGQVLVDVGLESPVRVCHFPSRGDSRDEDRYRQFRPDDDGSELIHGHTHGRWRQRGLQIDVGVDAWAGRPVGAATVARMLAAGPAELDALPWRL